MAAVRACFEGGSAATGRLDFNWRYVETQLPEDARALLARYAFVADAQALCERAPQLAD